jgi:hypothetical protein
MQAAAGRHGIPTLAAPVRPRLSPARDSYESLSTTEKAREWFSRKG